jgi:hypothetical protein
MRSLYSAFAEQTHEFNIDQFESRVDLMELSSDVWLRADGPRDTVN